MITETPTNEHVILNMSTERQKNGGDIDINELYRRYNDFYRSTLNVSKN